MPEVVFNFWNLTQYPPANLQIQTTKLLNGRAFEEYNVRRKIGTRRNRESVNTRTFPKVLCTNNSILNKGQISASTAVCVFMTQLHKAHVGDYKLFVNEVDASTLLYAQLN